MAKHKVEIASHALAAIALVAVLKVGLLAALLSGLFVYQLVTSLSQSFFRLGLTHAPGRIAAFMIPLVMVAVAVAIAMVQILALITGPDSAVALLQRMAEILGSSRQYIPAWAQNYLPSNMDELEAVSAQWLQQNAGQLGLMSQSAMRTVFQIIIGMIVGGLVAYHGGVTRPHPGQLVCALTDRIDALSGAFRNVVFSQIRISGLNTLLTAIYLAGVLPLLGASLPLVKTMIAVTFVAGLLPVLGNLISNTVIVVVSLSVSPAVAAGSLAFLVAIHKLEYFANAQIIGTRIKAHAWELLTAMLVMEAVFGIPGLIAAPIYYAYLKDELVRLRLV